jgi:hypothetical protein
MKKLALPLILLIVLVTAVGLAWVTVAQVPWARRVLRDGPPVSTTHEVPAFSRIDVTGAADVRLVQGTRPSVVVDAPENAQQWIVVGNRGDTLTLRSSGASRGWNNWFGGTASAPVKITVTFTTLEMIDVSGKLTLNAEHIQVPRLAFDIAGSGAVTIKDLVTDELRIDGSGSMLADIAGRATTQRVSISGAGDYNAPHLLSENATVEVSGAGKVVVNASRKLDIDLSGFGLVNYVGNPELHKSVSGMGRVNQVNAALEGTQPVGVLPRVSSMRVAQARRRAPSPA